MEISGNPIKVITDPPDRTITIKVLKSFLGKNAKPQKWGYLCALLSQDGFPSPGVRRVRDVKRKAEQWRIGGAPDDTNHTRIMDLIWPKGKTPSQEELLSDYPPSHKKNTDSLTAGDFARIPLLYAK